MAKRDRSSAGSIPKLWELELIGNQFSTQKCRFMGKEVREISHFIVESPCVFAPTVSALPRTLLPTNTLVNSLFHGKKWQKRINSRFPGIGNDPTLDGRGWRDTNRQGVGIAWTMTPI